jgi:hypothetical protein
MEVLLGILLGIFGITILGLCVANLVCFIIMQIKMVKHDQSTMATITTILFCCTGTGFLIAFVYGWTKAKEWGMERFMLIWSVFFGIAVVGEITFRALGLTH